MAYRIDLTSAVMGSPQHVNAIKARVEAGARLTRNAIVRGMEEADPRSGREYRVGGVIDEATGKIKPGTGTLYTASAPGEPPAVRTGTYLGRWQTTPAVVTGTRVSAAAVNDAKTEDGEHYIGELLEYGTHRATAASGGGTIMPYEASMAPRPHIRTAVEEVAEQLGARVVEG